MIIVNEDISLYKKQSIKGRYLVKTDSNTTAVAFFNINNEGVKLKSLIGENSFIIEGSGWLGINTTSTIQLCKTDDYNQFFFQLLY